MMFRKRTHRAGLQPYEDVVRLEVDGREAYRAYGRDPRMIWTPEDPRSEALDGRSAIRVKTTLKAIQGKLLAPCVYFDWGDGFSEETRRPMSRAEADSYVAVASTNAGRCRAIRFDPSTADCVFEISSFSVEAIGARSADVPRLSLMRRGARRMLRPLPPSVQELVRRSIRSASRFRGGAIRSNGGRWRRAYTHAFSVAQNLRDRDFAAPALLPPRRDPSEAKVVAFYLPQFHPIPENDAWWGRGFTEWTNVTKAIPQFTGHVQPRLPGELGFYDLRTPGVLCEQVTLAKRAGVDAFCFHYYWFGGRRVLERPLDDFSKDENLDFPFALCWANENWTRRWDGSESEILLAQKHSPEDDEAVFLDLCRYIRQPRYLKVAERPLLIIYRPEILPNATETVSRWRAIAKREGIGELFLLCTDAFGFADYESFGFDGIVEFPPHGINVGEITDKVERLNTGFSGRIYDYETVVTTREDDLTLASDGRRFPGVMPAWDNEARKSGASHVFHGATPNLFRRWVQAALEATARTAPENERLVFINAWNEWAEGAYLEPDRWVGHGYAQGLRAALESRAPRISQEVPIVAASHLQPQRHQVVVLLHIFYVDLIEAFAQELEFAARHADLFISFPNTWAPDEVERLQRVFPSALLLPIENLGRDIAPFIALLKIAKQHGKEIFCKLHSKKSPHLANGGRVREDLVKSLAGDGALDRALDAFANDDRLGLLAPAFSRVELGDGAVMHHNRQNVEYLSKKLSFSYAPDTVFAGGSMFWGRVAAFEPLLSSISDTLAFEVELGQIDGTLAHALERSMAAIVESTGFNASFSL